MLLLKHGLWGRAFLDSMASHSARQTLAFPGSQLHGSGPGSVAAGRSSLGASPGSSHPPHVSPGSSHPPHEDILIP